MLIPLDVRFGSWSVRHGFIKKAADSPEDSSFIIMMKTKSKS